MHKTFVSKLNGNFFCTNLLCIQDDNCLGDCYDLMTHNHLLLLDEVPHGCVRGVCDDVRVSDDQEWLMIHQQPPLPGQISEMIL